MAGIPGWSVNALGAVLALLALRDIFHTIWRPSGRGGLSRRLMRVAWHVGGHGRRLRWLRPLTGPLGMVAVVTAWVLLVVLAWALVYWPHLPTGFVFGNGLEAAERAGFLDAVYLSLVTLATLGFGDIVPESGWLRIAVPVQALIGFILITAAVSWVLQVYPALTRRRALAVRLSLLGRVDTLGLVEKPGSSLAPVLLEGIAGEIVQVRVDVTQYAETYYFWDVDPDASLAARLGIAVELAEAAGRSAQTDIRFAGDLLRTAVGDFARILDEEFLRVGGPVPEVVMAYADEHRFSSASA